MLAFGDRTYLFHYTVMRIEIVRKHDSCVSLITWSRRSTEPTLCLRILALQGQMRRRFSFGERHSLSALAAQWNIERLLQYHRQEETDRVTNADVGKRTWLRYFSKRENNREISNFALSNFVHIGNLSSSNRRGKRLDNIEFFLSLKKIGNLSINHLSLFSREEFVNGEDSNDSDFVKLSKCL